MRIDPFIYFLSRLLRPLLRIAGPAGLVFLLLSWSVQPAAAQVSKEYQLKAVCLWRLAQFVEWPTNAFAQPDSPLVICVLGKSRFQDALDTVVRGETARGRKITVEYRTRAEQIPECHILFVCDSETRRVPQILGAVAGKSVLTVSDIEDFTRLYDGMIRLLTGENHIKLRINPDAAAAAGLVLDTRLLRVAEIVRKK